MSQLSYANYENRLAAREAKARQDERDSFKPFHACGHNLYLNSIEYKPTKNGAPRWIGQVTVSMMLVDDLPITLWQEDIDFLNKCTGLNIGTGAVDLEQYLITIQTHNCHPQFGLNRVWMVQYKATHYYKDETMNDPEPPKPAPAAATPKKQRRDSYLHLRDLLRKNGVVVLPYGDPLEAKMAVLVRMGYAKAPIAKTNIWTAIDRTKTATNVATDPIAASLLTRAENTEKAIASASSEAHAANLQKQVNKDLAAIAAVTVIEKPQALPLVGDKVVYNGKQCPIVHVIPNGQGGQVFIRIKTPYKTSKGWSTNIVTRPYAEFENVSYQAVA